MNLPNEFEEHGLELDVTNYKNLSSNIASFLNGSDVPREAKDGLITLLVNICINIAASVALSASPDHVEDCPNDWLHYPWAFLRFIADHLDDDLNPVDVTFEDAREDFWEPVIRAEREREADDLLSELNEDFNVDDILRAGDA